MKIRSDPIKLEEVCVDSNGPSKLTECVVKKFLNFKIICFHSVYTCDINTQKHYNKHASYKIEIEMVKGKYGCSPPRAVKFPHLVLAENNVKISYGKAWKAKEVALENVRGNEVECYRFLPTYLYLLRKANREIFYHIHSELVDDGYSRFKYLFVSIGELIKGLRYIQIVIVVEKYS